ncbi:MAG TPA: hypothetical protein VLT33_50265, partial [Labilithrix sp.]|nr:hypothetical protein [Labilithrix sp.]
MTVRRLLVLLAFLGAPACRCDRAPSGEGGPITTPPPAATARRLAPITGPVSGMVLDDTHAFLSAEGAGSIVRVAKTSGDVKVLATREPGPQALALAGST